MKKITSILLALVLVLSLAACAPKDLAAEIKGTWTVDFEVSPADMGLDTMGLETGMVIPLIYTFAEDGTYSMTVNAERFTERFAEFMTGTKTFIQEMMVQEFEAQGIDPEEGIAAFEQEAGMTFDAYMDSVLEALDMETLTDTIVESMVSQGTYAVEEAGKLSICAEGEENNAEVCSFEVKDNTLTILDTNESKSESQFPATPLTLTEAAA